jgi:hypothetical protein
MDAWQAQGKKGGKNEQFRLTSGNVASEKTISKQVYISKFNLRFKFWSAKPGFARESLSGSDPEHPEENNSERFRHHGTAPHSR